ncbi:hypothetical protein LCGC14_0603000 [marine sediment metagenome]|uniref:Peptidase M20 dimerisation domain-containing protein n=1 Tax=marine sediment metagenome TaxID=412755 RepID=A0A0F9TW67_9ZZZZ|nr:MAG: Succinyl-diaminopimelate desuccinylase [Candidatus Lokiarchaeum sp. GC14_75]
MNSFYKHEKQIKETNEKFIEVDLQPFLKIPSNSNNKKGINEGKDFLISYISGFCEDVKIFSGDINPLILARVKGSLETELLIYMMYDTQPIDSEKNWVSKPFGAEISTLPPPLDVLGNCIIARGAYNSKTPLICFLNIIKILKEIGELPISLVLLIDGEEEIGSPSLLKFIVKNKDLFKNCIDAYYPSTKQDLTGNAVLKLGYKGILSLRIEISSHNKEIHSAFSALIPNPAMDLISLLNTLYANNEFQIESLSKDYEVSTEEKLIIHDLMSKFDFETVKKKAGIQKTHENDTLEVINNFMFKPSFNISTLKSGFLDKGSRNYVPNKALCNVDIRFAHNITVNHIFQEIKEKIDLFSKTVESDIKLSKNVGYEGSRIKKDSELVQSLIKSAKTLGVETQIWPLSAAASPLSSIQKILGLNFVVGGLGIGGYAHAPNEFIQYDSIVNTRLSNYKFLKIYSQLIKNKSEHSV